MTITWRGPIPVWNPQTGTGNYRVGREDDTITGIVIHTMVTDLAGADATFHSPTRIASAHYGIGYDGQTVYQWVSDGDTAFHCGRLDEDAVHPFANDTTLGIEHDDQGRPFDPRPDALYAASAALVASKCHQYDIPIDRDHIKKHSEVSINPTGCPDTLDIDRIVREAQALGIPLQESPMSQSFGPTTTDSYAAGLYQGQPGPYKNRDVWVKVGTDSALQSGGVKLNVYFVPETGTGPAVSTITLPATGGEQGVKCPLPQGTAHWIRIEHVSGGAYFARVYEEFLG